MTQATESITILAKEMISNGNAETFIMYGYRLPISEIDGIALNAWLSFENDKWQLKIESKLLEHVEEYSKEFGCHIHDYVLYLKSFERDETELTLNTQGQYEKILRQVIDEIDSIKFDNYSGTFVKKDISTKISVIWQSLLPKDTIKYDHSDCGVCYNSTITKTCCNHSVCVSCCLKIKPATKGQKLCPLCKEDLYL